MGSRGRALDGGKEGEPPEAENVLAPKHPKKGQMCQILDILDKKLTSD